MHHIKSRKMGLAGTSLSDGRAVLCMHHMSNLGSSSLCGLTLVQYIIMSLLCFSHSATFVCHFILTRNSLGFTGFATRSSLQARPAACWHCMWARAVYWGGPIALHCSWSCLRKSQPCVLLEQHVSWTGGPCHVPIQPINSCWLGCSACTILLVV